MSKEVTSVGRPQKYTTHVLPHLQEIAQWRKQGMKLSSIAEKLDIVPSTLYEYQKEYPELSNALTTAQKELYADMVIRAEDSLYQKLEDRFEVVEIKHRIYLDDDGNPHEATEKIERRIPADTTALIFTLKNRNPDYWKDRSELGVSGSIDIIPQPLAPVREQDILEGEIVEVESLDEAD